MNLGIGFIVSLTCDDNASLSTRETWQRGGGGGRGGWQRQREWREHTERHTKRDQVLQSLGETFQCEKIENVCIACCSIQKCMPFGLNKAKIAVVALNATGNRIEQFIDVCSGCCCCCCYLVKYFMQTCHSTSEFLHLMRQ